jgi:putative membrane protein
MLLEPALAYVHLAFIFSLIVFQGSLAALLRPEWFNAALLQRLQRVALINKIATALLLASGIVRLFWGIKPAAWYLANPLMHAKLTLVIIMLALAIPTYRAIKNWQRTYAATGALPDAAAIQNARRWAMRSSHLMLLIPVFAVLMAHGYSSLRLW